LEKPNGVNSVALRCTSSQLFNRLNVGVTWNSSRIVLFRAPRFSKF